MYVASTELGMIQESKGSPIKMGNNPAGGSRPGVYHLVNLPPPVVAPKFVEVSVIAVQEITIEPHKGGAFVHALRVFQDGSLVQTFTFDKYRTWTTKNDSNGPWSFKFEDIFVRECNQGLLYFFSEGKEKATSKVKIVSDSPARKRSGFDDYKVRLFCGDDADGDGDLNDVWVDVILK